MHIVGVWKTNTSSHRWCNVPFQKLTPTVSPHRPATLNLCVDEQTNDSCVFIIFSQTNDILIAMIELIYIISKLFKQNVYNLNKIFGICSVDEIIIVANDVKK